MKCKAISLSHARAGKPFVSIIIHEHGPADYFNSIRMSPLFSTSGWTKHSSCLNLCDAKMGEQCAEKIISALILCVAAGAVKCCL